MSLTTNVLIALAAGVGVGLALSEIRPDLALETATFVEPIGTVFVNAIRMTVIPLVVSTLIVGIATVGSGADVARIGGRGVALFVLLLVASGTVGALIAPPLLSTVKIDPTAVAALRTSASSASDIQSGAAAIQTPAQWLVSVVPANPFRAAADGAMLPLIVFALIFGLALANVPSETRDRVVVIFRGLSVSMLVVVRWLLVVAPIGVFALALPLVARLGVSAVGALATYVVLVSVAAAVFAIVVLYPAAAWFGRVSLRDFARAVAPGQAVAFSSRSSLAALPALMESGRTRLQLPEEICGFFLPLAAAMFRVGATLGLTVGAVFIGRLYGVQIGPSQLVTIVVTATITSFGIPGIPGGSIIAMVPVLASVGLPVEGVGILLGVDTIPDMFRTAANSTGQLAAAAIVAGGAKRDASAGDGG
ncbi:MAG: dicarboxylate/amino acid:cation symporter [Gemmatimonadaceae bacterium]